MVDGVMVMTSRIEQRLIDEIQAYDLPAVITDYDGKSSKNVGIVSIDFEHGIREMVSHLLALGHRSFAYVSGDTGLRTSNIRKDLFVRILSENGIPAENVGLYEGNFKIDGGRKALHKIVDAPRRPTAVFAVNDMTAIGVMLEAQEMGLSVPAGPVDRRGGQYRSRHRAESPPHDDRHSRPRPRGKSWACSSTSSIERHERR